MDAKYGIIACYGRRATVYSPTSHYHFHGDDTYYWQYGDYHL